MAGRPHSLPKEVAQKTIIHNSPGSFVFIVTFWLRTFIHSLSSFWHLSNCLAHHIGMVRTFCNIMVSFATTSMCARMSLSGGFFQRLCKW